MGTYIILVVLAVMTIFACRESFRHIKGQGGCCGGSIPSKKVKKQRLNKIISVKRIAIEGMTCEQCKKRVENELNAIRQVNATVSLKNKEAIVKLGEEVSEEQLISAVKNAGYRVTRIANV